MIKEILPTIIFTMVLLNTSVTPTIAGLSDAQLDTCVDDRLGIKFRCNPEWPIITDNESLLISIKETTTDVVSLTVGRSAEQGINFADLTRSTLREIGQYADFFSIEDIMIGQEKAIRVKAEATAAPDAKLMDYYLIHEGQLYSFMFLVSPKEQFRNYEMLFERIMDGFEFLPTSHEPSPK